MLVLSRKKDESLMIGDNVIIKIIEIDEGRVKIGIEAPKSIEINRKEIYDKIMDENREATTNTSRLKELKNLNGIIKKKWLNKF